MDTPLQENLESATVNRSSAERITLSELERAVRDADSAALMVLPRILRRVIKQDRQLPGFAYRIPHRKSYVIDREPLLEIVDYEELGVPPEERLPDKVILLAQPQPQKLAETPAGAALLRSWRLLFHARVHLAIQQSFVLGFLSPSQVRKRIHQIGETEFDEIRAVLQHEGFLLPPRDIHSQKNILLQPLDDAAVYEEFAAVFFELKFFAWNSLPRYFPDLADFAVVAAVLELDVNARALFEATRPSGAPLPTDEIGLDEHTEETADFDDQPPPSLSPAAEFPSEEKYRKILRRAQRPSTLGNVVRAAIWRARALRYAPTEMIARTKVGVHDDVNRLILRLRAALELHDPSPQPWHDALRALVYSAADGFWTAEARLLYDLQKVCIDHEREIYSVNLLSWLWSHIIFAVKWLFCRREGEAPAEPKSARGIREGEAPAEPKIATSETTPARHEPRPPGTNQSLLAPLKRPLPNQRDVLMSQHLRTAQRRLTAVRLPENKRKQLGELLRTAIGRVESQLRERFRPLLLQAFDEVGLKPANFPEKIARDKLVEELLDQVAERGFLSIGDVRDALSRNNMKLPDFGGVKDLFYGDPLLKADRRLGEILRGIYRPAEFYLRWLQQFTSLGFGTRTGRFLTLYLAVPFGGAFLIEEFVDHFFHKHWPNIRHYEAPAYWLLSFLFLGLVNVESFRRFVWQALKSSARFLAHWVFLPMWRIIHSHVVQVILHSRAFRLLFRFLLKPALLTAVIWFAFPLQGIPWPTLAGRAAILFLGLNLLLNSRVGRTIEEMIADWTVQTWHRYGLRFLMGVLWWMVDLFKTLLETVERLMYGVDEWLRFKTGDRRVLFAMKAVLGLVWAAVAYVLRFCVNLLIEPQINPIKHFPVVTVSHKMLFPLYPYLGGIFAMHMEKEWAYTTATLFIWCIPGIFGFLVWELKENWRLYAANRPKGLQPMIVGSHGETMGRLLRPGFHSGTIPKLFAKLRRADRKARKSGDWKTVRKHLHGFERVEQSLRRYVERDFLALFNESRRKEPSSDGTGLLLGEIQLGTNRVRLLFSPADAAQPRSTRGIGTRGIGEGEAPAEPRWAIDFDVESGWLLGGLRQIGPAQPPTDNDREELSTAILGLYKTAGADLVRQQLAAALPPSISAYDVSSDHVRIWPDASFETEAFYEFTDALEFPPQLLHGYLNRPLPTLQRKQILFRETLLPWQTWVAFWDAVKKKKSRKGKELLLFPVLPTLK